MPHLATILLSAALTVPAGESEPPLKPFLDLAQALDRGMAAWLEGGEAAKAWPDWASGERAGVRAALKEKGVASARTFGFEFEVSLLREGKAVARAEFLIVIIQGNVTIGEARTRLASDGPGGAAVGNVKDKTGLIGKSAEALVRVITRASGVEDLPVTNPEDLAKIVPSKKMIEQARKEIPEAKAKLTTVIEEFKKAKHDALYVRLDDQVYLAYDEQKNVIGGIRGDFDLDSDGSLKYDLQRFLPFPKE